MEIDLAEINTNNTFTDGSVIYGEKLVAPSKVTLITDSHPSLSQEKMLLHSSLNADTTGEKSSLLRFAQAL
jgi:hypothetical protein